MSNAFGAAADFIGGMIKSGILFCIFAAMIIIRFMTYDGSDDSIVTPMTICGLLCIANIVLYVIGLAIANARGMLIGAGKWTGRWAANWVAMQIVSYLFPPLGIAIKVVKALISAPSVIDVIRGIPRMILLAIVGFIGMILTTVILYMCVYDAGRFGICGIQAVKHTWIVILTFIRNHNSPPPYIKSRWHYLSNLNVAYLVFSAAAALILGFKCTFRFASFLQSVIIIMIPIGAVFYGIGSAIGAA